MKKHTHVFTVILFLLFCSFSIHSQVPSFGKDTLLDIGCWNLEWFGSTDYGPTNEELQFANVKQVLNITDLDIWGLCEVSNNTTYNALLDELPQYGGALATYFQTQKTAVFYKKELFDLVSANHILTASSYNYDFAGRPPLEVVLKTKSVSPDTLYVIVIHLKAYAEQESYDRRKSAALFLKNNYLDLYRVNKKTIVLGDWNDDLDVSITNALPTPFQDFLDDSVNYFFPTQELSDAGKTSYAFYSGSFLDHMLVNQPLKEAYVPNSAKVLDMMSGFIFQFSQNTSDHFPVLSSFKLADLLTLSISQHTWPEQLISLLENSKSLTFQGNWKGDIQIYSVSGQLLHSAQKQEEQLTISLEEFPLGLYVVSCTQLGATRTARFVRY